MNYRYRNRVALRVVLFAGAFPLTIAPVQGQCEQFRRGDSNDDGNGDLSDAIFTLAWRFLGGPAPGCDDAADTNDDGSIDLADPVHLMNFLFRGGPAPPLPGLLRCGPDPTPDRLSCARYRNCDSCCETNTDCARDQFCAKAAGDCDGVGSCQVRPEACPRIFDPVCGCDGVTYSNECLANAAGASIVRRGECETTVCGGIAGIPCAEDEFCEFAPDTCSIVDNQGVCVQIPLGCPDVFDPVCGCDGVTYGNDCDRQAAGVSKAHDGECRDGTVCGGIIGLPCPRGQFCDLPAGLCNGADLQGTCVPVPEACLAVFDPVCGCDGVTYGNDCERQMAQVQKAHDGICGEGQVCGGFIGVPCPPGEFCDLPAGECNGADLQGVCRPIPQICTRIFDPVCGCDGVTYSNDCERQVAQVQKAHDGACGVVAECGGVDRIPCPDGFFCEFATGSCDVAGNGGECVEIPTACPDIFDPVCGCDGRTYSNDCDRQAASVSKAHDGECRDVCGGIQGLPCPDGEFCELPPGQCNGADLQGVCTPIPEACIAIFDPVCGCDGRTYGNDCERQAAQVQKAHDGECRNEDFCGGIAGFPCAAGEFCEFAPGTCNVADNAGTCVPRPTICPAIFDPVCGCDGRTYGNDCERRAAGAQKAHDGTCE